MVFIDGSIVLSSFLPHSAVQTIEPKVKEASRDLAETPPLKALTQENAGGKKVLCMNPITLGGIGRWNRKKKSVDAQKARGGSW